MARREWFLLALCALFAGCTVGPNYQRPKVDVPPAYRGPENSAAATASSIGDEKWWSVFQDPQLQNLIRLALAKNYDVRIAASRIEQQRAQLAITRSNQFPTLSGVAEETGLRSPPIGAGVPSYSYNAVELALSASWDVDFWGKYRRATEGARANLLASEWARQAVISSLVANVATDYFALRDLDLQLEISERTLKSRRNSLQLTETLEKGGSSPLTDVRQAEQLVETAAATIPDLQRQIQQEENAIRVLIGENPGPITRGLALTDQPIPVDVPPGLPSALLERRPDIREAEQSLIAANAQIGVAKAAYYPDISLTGIFGLESGSLLSLFNGSARAWNYTASATQPIFEAGRLRGNVRLAQGQQQQALLSYQQTIQGAFRDVSNALIAVQKYREFREHEELLVKAAKGASDLSEMRYKGGVTSYLEVLTNETNYFAAELNLAGARLNERLSLVQLYNALGGGWQL